VGLLIVRIVELLIVIVPLIGLMYGGYKAVSKVRERADAPARIDAPEPERRNSAVQWQAIMRMVREHDRTDTRWLDYEIDISKLLDYPLMTDMRDPLTQRFHRAKLRADMLRPADAGDLLDDTETTRQYLDAVEEYVTAFDVAEAEAIRKRRSDFSREDQQRLSRAHGAMRIATDSAATPQEREHAFDVARRELDGLVVLPERTRAAIERGITGELDR
jgi:limonene-1,2-epoxide hydrolase